MKKALIVSIFSFALLLSGGLSVLAATRTVTKTADTNDGTCDSDCSLREAIAVAASGDTIVFGSPVFDSTQTIMLAFGQLSVTRNLTINGRGSANTIISANSLSRVMSNTATLTLNGLTIRDGRDTSPGGLNGGGLFNSGTMTVNNCTISFNRVVAFNARGGGIHNDGTLTVASSIVSDNTMNGNGVNSGGLGAGIYAGGPVVIRDSSIARNTIDDLNQGGNSFGTAWGAGIYIEATTVDIGGSSFYGNGINASGSAKGGGIGSTNGASVSIVNTTISGNYTSSYSNGQSYGGGILAEDLGNWRLINSTITNNTAGGSTSIRVGGGIYTRASQLRLVNTIITGNNANTFADGYFDAAHTITLNLNNIIGGVAQLAPLADNGGPTQTNALMYNSPAINAGNTCVLTANGCGFTHQALSTDQRGFARATDGAGSGLLPDVGAYEFPTMVTNLSDVDGNPGSFRYAVANVPTNGEINFSPAVFNIQRTINLTLLADILVSRNMTINGPGSSLLTVNRQNGNFRIFAVTSGATLNLNGISLTGGTGASEDGGTILNSGTINSNDLVVALGRATTGGCIANRPGGTLNLFLTRIDGCTATDSGGGIYNDGSLTMDYSTIANSNSQGGGAIYNNAGLTTTINYTTISGNTSTGNGGGVFNRGSFFAYASTFYGNSAQGAGAVMAGPLSIINNSTISGNVATTGPGGGVYVLSGARLDTTNSTITNNVSNNNQTGGIYNEGTYNTRNSIISGNRNGSGTGAQDVAGFMTSFSHNLRGSTIGNSIIGDTTGDLVGVANLAPLSNYGGFTLTHALLPNSSAINSGDPNNSFIIDQRASTKPIGGRGDMGSFERNIAIDQATLPNANQNVAYNRTLTVTRSTGFADGIQDAKKEDQASILAPFTFSIVPASGQGLPPGLTLSPAGVLSGTPTTIGVYTFTVKATDADGMAGAQQYTMYSFAPTAANVSISGRLLTASGQGLRGAVVKLTGSDGISRTSASTSLGYFRFDDIASGGTYTISVQSKRFAFASRLITVNDAIENLELIAEP